MLEDHTHLPPVSRSLILRRGLSRCCPNCGARGLFRGGLTLRYRCPACGLKLSRSEGFFLGAMVWNYGLTVFGFFPLILLAGWLHWLSITWVIGLCLTAGLIGPFLGYRQAWGLWLATYYFVLPHELPANISSARPVDEDE